MGYESKIYIVSENGWGVRHDEGGNKHSPFCAEILATFNLCCAPQKIREVFAHADEARCYIIENDEHIVEDCYGDKIKSVDISTLFAAITNDKECREYWRTNALAGFLWQIIDNHNLTRDPHSLKAYHFGY